MFRNSFNNKKILITGHTGFKGSWLTKWMLKLGAKVCGVSLKPQKLSNFLLLNLKDKVENNYVDIRKSDEFEKIILKFKPDFVFHLAAQAIVKTSFDDPKLTWETNVIGTMNLLEGLRKLHNKCCAIIITSDKCYYNQEWIWGYKETDILGGKDPYSASKASAENVIYSYINSFFNHPQNKIRIVSARAGNVIGGGDWSEDRIVPDCMRSWIKNKKVLIKNPLSTRPWQHVLEPLGGYIHLAQLLHKNKNLHGESFNFGPPLSQNKTVLDIVKEFSKHFDNSEWAIPKTKSKKFFESNLLKLNCEKAFQYLKWRPVLDFSDLVLFTSEWYQSYIDKKDLENLTDLQIEKYFSKAVNKGNLWIK